MGFLSKIVKHAKKDLKKSVGITKKVTMRPLKDAKKAVGVGNKLSGKVGGPKVPTRLSRNPKAALRDVGLGGGPIRGGAGRPKAPSATPAGRPIAGAGRRPSMAPPGIGGGRGGRGRFPM